MNNVKVKRFRAMNGSLVVKAKARLVYEKPKLSLNDSRSKTINDRCEELKLQLAKLNAIKLK